MEEDVYSTSYKTASDELCQSFAATARRLCTWLVDPMSTSPEPRCPPDRHRGTVRRIIAKAVLSIIRGDVQDAVGTVQLYGGQISGIEASVHVVRALFRSDENEAVLLVGASNAFNSLNR